MMLRALIGRRAHMPVTDAGRRDAKLQTLLRRHGPAHRGRGVYRGLYRHIQRLAARRRSVVGFRLYVDHDNARARRVYRSLGMKETRYAVFEQLKRGIRFFTPARKARR